MTARSIWIGYDPREAAAFAVARHSILQHLPAESDIEINGLVLGDMQRAGLFTRPLEKRDGVTWDLLSGAPCATEFSNSRFLVPHIAGDDGWALFVDCDMLFRVDVTQLFEACDASKAVMVVKHDHRPAEVTKMDGQVQTLYARKNWSSVACFNLSHPANRRLTLDMVNSLPGRDLHAFCWLEDGEIGELDVEWNWLVGHSDPDVEPKNVHFTDGIPLMPGYQDVPFADEWRDTLADWAAGA